MTTNDNATFVVEKASLEDAEEIIKYLNLVGGESDNLLFGENDFHMSVEQEERFIAGINSTSHSVLLVGKCNGAIVSVGSLMGNSRERIAHRAEIAISVMKDYWNNGYGTKMMKELIKYGKERSKIEVIELKVKTDNVRAIHVYESLGFKKIGTYEKFFKIDGLYYDSLLMTLDCID